MYSIYKFYDELKKIYDKVTLEIEYEQKQAINLTKQGNSIMLIHRYDFCQILDELI